MDESWLRRLLTAFQSGERSLDDTLSELAKLPYEDIGVATIDHHRALRQGVPEVIFGEGKTADQICQITETMQKAGSAVLVTRIDADKAARLADAFPAARFNALARVAYLAGETPTPTVPGTVAVVTAGTSDLPVAEEARETLSALGLETLPINDVGVAGLQRILGRLPALRSVDAVVVVAGMEGALPSVLAGLVACPLVAVPTSVGYGSSFGGITAMLGMLNACASGLSVVNIDNGFGAAMAAYRILSYPERKSAP